MVRLDPTAYYFCQPLASETDGYGGRVFSASADHRLGEQPAAKPRVRPSARDGWTLPEVQLTTKYIRSEEMLPQGTLREPLRGAVLAHIDGLRPKIFARSPKLFGLLRFVVEEAIEGRDAGLKELVIGHSLYGGIDPYDPRIDSAVRVEARRLRRKLNEYYANAGADDLIFVSLPTGGYVPRFAIRSPAQRRPFVRHFAEKCIPHIGKPPLLAIFPLISQPGRENGSSFADGVTDELIFSAERSQMFRLVPRVIMFQFLHEKYSFTDIMRQTKADMLLFGNMRRDKGIHRLSLELSDYSGTIMWSHRMDLNNGTDFSAQEQTAANIVSLLCRDRAIWEWYWAGVLSRL